MMTYSRIHPRARKSHACETCCRVIQPGETYMRGSGYGSGEAYTWKECAHCEKYVELVARRLGEDEYSFDSIAEWDEPKSIAEARVLVQFRRKWRNRAGDLYPIPHVVIVEDSMGFGWPRTLIPGEVAAA